MPIQPIKNVSNYEKKFSNEIRNLLNNTIQDIARETIPSSYITPEFFFLGALNNSDCMLYKVLNGYLTSIKIEEIYDKIYLEVEESSSITVVHPNRVLDYSAELKLLFKRANEEIEKLGVSLITSDYVLLALMNEDTDEKFYQFLKDLFANESLSYDIILNLIKESHEAIDPFANLDEKDISDVFVDLGEGNDYTSTAITIMGSIDDTPEEMAKRIEDALGQFNIKRPKNTKQPTKKKSAPSYCTDLNALAEKKEIDPIVGREKEIDNIVKTLNRRKCNNVVLVGESGVGKTAIVEGIARQIADGTAPATIRDCKIYRMNVSDMMAGTQFRGMFEERIVNFIKSINDTKNVILFIDDIHNIISEKQKAEYDLVGMLSPVLTEGKVKVIATTTNKGYHYTFEGDGELSRKFQKITVEAPSQEDCISILKNNKKYYEKYHNVEYTDEAISACVTLSKRYVTDRNLPSSAIDILDEAGAAKKIELFEPDSIKAKREAIAEYNKEKDELIKADKIEEAKNIDYKINGIKLEIGEINDALGDLRKNNIITLDDIYKTVSEHTNIPIQKINISEKKFLSQIDTILKKEIIGQDEAINVVTRAIKRSKVGLFPPNRPIFSCMEIGGSGVGKTLLAKKLAKEIFGDEKYLVRFDMSEYSDKTAVNKLIGASAGYVGYNEGGLLTQAIKNKKHAVLLIDEIEKADDEVYNLFLQILDEGMLTDNTGQKVDFKNVILIMTSNVGAKRAASEKRIGFTVDDSLNKKDIIEKELKKKFPPEFINRLDEIVYFNELKENDLKKIITLELNNLFYKLKGISKDYIFDYDKTVVEYVYKQIENEKEYGARPILRTIQNDIENRITDLILENDYDKHTFIARYNDNKLNID